MRTLITEYKRMFFEKKLIWLLAVTIVYVTICSLFWELRFKLDYNYVEVHYKASAFKLWQDTINKSFMAKLMIIVPPMICIFSFMDDRENGIDNQICMRNHSNIYYIAKYITVITGGMLYNFLSVVLIYIPLYFLLSRGNRNWNYLDIEDATVGALFKGDTAIEFVLIIAAAYAFIGGVCAAMSYVISMWINNRVLVCITPYIIFQIIQDILIKRNMSKLTKIILGNVDIYMEEIPFTYYIYHFIWWFLVLSIILAVSYVINVRNKR